MRWAHVGLNCRDPRVTVDFYVQWFGFSLARVVPLDGQEIIFLRNDASYLELFASSQSQSQLGQGDGPQNPGAIRHLAFQVDNVDSFLKEIGDAADITLGPLNFDPFIPGWRTVWIRDPDGVIIEVSQGYHDQRPEELSGQ